MERKALQLSDVELKFSGDGAGTFEGYASVFGGVDSYGDTILPGAYKGIITGISSGNTRAPKMFFNHRSWEVPIGKYVSLKEDTHGLLVKGELTPDHPVAATVRAAMKHGTLDGLSIGYSLKKNDYEYVQKDGREIRVIKNISSLPETSVVTYPADDPARIDLSSVKSALDEIQTIRDFEEFLRDAAGFSKALATAAASQAKRIFSQRESGEQIDLPSELQRQIAENLKFARTLKGE